MTWMRKSQGVGALVVIIIVVVVVLLGGTGYFVWKSRTKPVPSTSNSPSAGNSNATTSLMSLCQTNNPGMTCEVTKVDGNYAYGSASGTGGGAVWYAKKVDDKWTIVIPGVQNDPPCAKTTDFPKTIVPVCSK